MAAWATLTANHPSPWEVDVIKALDQAHLEHLAASRKPPQRQQGER